MKRAEREARSRPTRPYDHFSMATSTSQVITEAGEKKISVGGRAENQNLGPTSTKNQPINSKLNAALRHRDNQRLLGDNRQLQVIDKIWGRFDKALANHHS